jgi:hypothetical protein
MHVGLDANRSSQVMDMHAGLLGAHERGQDKDLSDTCPQDDG